MSEPLAYPMTQIPAVAGIGRTTAYAEVKAGRLRTTKIGRRTVVLREDLEAWLRARRDEGEAAPRDVA